MVPLRARRLSSSRSLFGDTDYLSCYLICRISRAESRETGDRAEPRDRRQGRAEREGNLMLSVAQHRNIIFFNLSYDLKSPRYNNPLSYLMIRKIYKKIPILQKRIQCTCTNTFPFL